MTTDELIRFLRNYADYELSNGRVVSNDRLLDCADRLEELDERIDIMAADMVISLGEREKGGESVDAK